MLYNFLTNRREKLRHFLSVLCFTPNCKAEVWTANSLLQLFWILDRNRETNCHRLLMDFLTLLIQHSESSQSQTFSLRLLTSSTICTSHHLDLKCTQNNLAQVVKRWIVLSTGPWLFKRSIAQLVFLILIHWIVIYKVDGAIQYLNIRDQINLYPVDNTTLLISLLFISWIVIGLAPVVQTLDSAIHRINHYPADKYLGNQLRYPLDKDLSIG